MSVLSLYTERVLVTQCAEAPQFDDESCGPSECKDPLAIGSNPSFTQFDLWSIITIWGFQNTLCVILGVPSTTS